MEFLSRFLPKTRKFIIFLSRDKRVVLGRRSYASSLLFRPLFFSDAFLFGYQPNGRRLLLASLFFLRILYDFIVGKRPSVRFLWHSLISLISDIIARFDIKDIKYCSCLNGIYYHLPFFLIWNIRAKWMQARKQNVIHLRVRSGAFLFCYSLPYRS